MIKNVDVYCTGSNSKFLSKDIATEFRGRSLEVHLMPLSFKEYNIIHCTINEALFKIIKMFGDYGCRVFDTFDYNSFEFKELKKEVVKIKLSKIKFFRG